MRLFENPGALSLYASDESGWFFDASGRHFGTWEDGWWITHGLSGKSVARRWRDGRREVRAFSKVEADHLKSFARGRLREAGKKVPHPWVKRIMAFDAEADLARFKKTYKRVGILPPDQYECAVVQVTEGCGWNRCGFCSFYKAQKFRIRTVEEILHHAEAVKSFLGAGIKRRRSIFLGEANALALPPRELERILWGLQQTLVPAMTDFRGVFSFIEPAESAVVSESDFRRLREAGLRRLYWGVETGDPALREALSKPGTLEDIVQSIRRTKAAGILTALIFMIGIGGQTYRDSHRERSLAWIRSLPLDADDLLFLSPLRGSDHLGEPPLSPAELDAEVLRWRSALTPPLRTAPYDIREFVY